MQVGSGHVDVSLPWLQYDKLSAKRNTKKVQTDALPTCACYDHDMYQQNCPRCGSARTVWTPIDLSREPGVPEFLKHRLPPLTWENWQCEDCHKTFQGERQPDGTLQIMGIISD